MSMSVDGEQLRVKLAEAHKQIEWLEKEILRLKLLLSNKDVMMNSFSTPKTVENGGESSI